MYYTISGFLYRQPLKIMFKMTFKIIKINKMIIGDNFNLLTR